MNENYLFKNACRLHTKFIIIRYLMSNTKGRLSGWEKATRHMELCSFYVAAYHGLIQQDDARVECEDIWERVHTKTQELTDFLDEVIGFPMDNEHPDYNKLALSFFEEFHKLAMLALENS